MITFNLIKWPEGVLSRLQLFATSWVLQAPLFTGFSQQEYCNRLPFPTPGDLPATGIEPGSPVLAGGFFTPEPPGKPQSNLCKTTTFRVVVTIKISIRPKIVVS